MRVCGDRGNGGREAWACSRVARRSSPAPSPARATPPAASDRVPLTPQAIADAAVEAAEAGAAIAHIHVRDPTTGKPARDPDLYAEVVERIRASGVDVVLNLTAGMGGDLTLGPPDAPLPPVGAGTDMASATERLAHVARLRPEICTLDCGTMNFGEGDYVMANSPSMLREMARQVQALGRPSRDRGLRHRPPRARQVAEGPGVIDDPVLVQLCMGIPWGAPDDIATLMALVQNLPAGWVFSAFSIGRNQMPYAALALIVGGNIRVGLEDNIWLEKGVLATNGQLVERARKVAEGMGVRLLAPTEVRARLKLTKGWALRAGLPRRRRHRRRLGGAADRERPRRRGLRPRPGRAGEARRGARQRRARLRQAHHGRAPEEGRRPPRRLHRRGRRRRRADRRGRARAPRGQAPRLRRGRGRRPPDRADRLLHLRHPALRPAGRAAATPSACSSPTPSTRSTCCRWSRSSPARAPARGRRPRHGPLPDPRHEADPASAARSRPSSPTACSKRSGARRSG